MLTKESRYRIGLKELGTHNVKIKLHQDVEATLKVVLNEAQ